MRSEIFANGTRGGRNVQYASARASARRARGFFCPCSCLTSSWDTGIQERAVGTRSEVELDVLVAAEFAIENAVELDARLVLVLDNQKELAQAVENCRGESACGARALSSAPQRRARAAEGIHKMWLHGGRSHFLVGCSSGVRARSGPRISGRYPGPICHDQFPGFVAATWLNN